MSEGNALSAAIERLTDMEGDDVLLPKDEVAALLLDRDALKADNEKLELPARMWNELIAAIADPQESDAVKRVMDAMEKQAIIYRDLRLNP